jgi:hypothetical protein
LPQRQSAKEQFMRHFTEQIAEVAIDCDLLTNTLFSTVAGARIDTA